MAARAAQIDQAMETAQIERRCNGRRTDAAESVHAFQEIALGFFGAEEARKNSAFHAECLVPARRALAHRVFQMRPHRKQRVVGITDVAGQRIGAVGAQVFVGFGRVDVAPVAFFKQTQRDAGIQQGAAAP